MGKGYRVLKGDAALGARAASFLLTSIWLPLVFLLSRSLSMKWDLAAAGDYVSLGSAISAG